MKKLTASDVLMAKFYVVDGISYPACEVAIGLFDAQGWRAMVACRTLGYEDAKTKGTLSLDAFGTRLAAYDPNLSVASLAVEPADYYLSHCGFGVRASAKEIEMARSYLIEGLTYSAAEKRAGIEHRNGRAAQDAVFKLGALRGRLERRTMTTEDFDGRLRVLRLHPDGKGA